MGVNVVKLGELCEILDSKRKPVTKKDRVAGEYPYYGATGIQDYVADYIFDEKLVLVGEDGAKWGAGENTAYAISGKCWVNNHAHVLRPNRNKVLDNYLIYYLNQLDLRPYITGAIIEKLNQEQLRNIPIPLPTIEEQNRIVSLIDKVDETRAKKKLANDKLDELIDTKFIELFGNPEINPYNWTIKKLEDVTTKITDGVHSKPVYTNSGVPFISVKDITTKKLLFDDCKFISEDAHKEYCKRCKPEYLDVLYTKVGATYGRACVVDTTEEFSLYVSVALIKPQKDVINPFFLKAVLNTDCVKRQADKRIKGIGVPDLHLIEIKNFVIPVPPMEEQAKFIAFVEKVGAQKQKNEHVVEQMNNLFNSLSQRAFKGEL